MTKTKITVIVICVVIAAIYAVISFAYYRSGYSSSPSGVTATPCAKSDKACNDLMDAARNIEGQS